MEKEDFLVALGFKGFTARIKRLSDTLMYDAKHVYRYSGIAIAPNWHLVFLLLQDEKRLTVTEISKKLDLSHPAVIKITGKMREKGFLTGMPHETDSRKTYLQLTEKSRRYLPELQEQWDLITTIIETLINEEFLSKLGDLENDLRNKSLLDRFKEKYDAQ
ncbi:MarR family transcriptional regulator [Maribacter sp. 2-571]|uniref:MarR family transcriptional regulator n=1 Tax=Maribacter sp. 2-571 TaxID=3417569 RepID=UPI003D32503C